MNTHSPTPPEPAGTDGDVIDATHAANMDVVTSTSIQLLNAPARRVSALVATLSRFTGEHTVTDDMLTHVEALALHPATTPADAADAGQLLTTLMERWARAGRCARQDLTKHQLLCELVTCGPDRSAALARSPMGTLSTLEVAYPLEELVAYHCRPLLRGLHPAVLVTALHLEPTFTGTLAELLATAATIAT